MINILLIDDQALLCEVLKTWLDVEDDIQVVGIGHNGQEAIEQVEKLQPDIVLMDIDMPQMNGLKATKIISQRFPQVKVIFLSGHDDDAYLGKSLRTGAKGYLLKNTTADKLVQKIRSVYNNVGLVKPEANNSTLEFLQNQLEELVETYRLKLDKLIKEYGNSTKNAEYFEQIEQKLEQRLNEIENQLNTAGTNKIDELEDKHQSNWKSIRQELININTQFNQANRNLSTQFKQQLSNLRQDFDNNLSTALDDWSRQRAALQEWAVQRDEMRPSLEEYESTTRQELKPVIKQIGVSFEDVDRQLRTMRNWLIASGVLTLLALAVSGYLLVTQVRSDSSLVAPSKDTVN